MKLFDNPSIWYRYIQIQDLTRTFSGSYYTIEETYLFWRIYGYTIRPAGTP